MHLHPNTHKLSTCGIVCKGKSKRFSFVVPAKAKRRLFGPIPQDLKPTLEYTVVVSPGCLSVPARQAGMNSLRWMALHCFLISGALKRYQGGGGRMRQGMSQAVCWRSGFVIGLGYCEGENPGSVVCIWRFVTTPESGCWICRYWQWITVPDVLNATPSLTVPCVCLLAGVLSKN